MEVRKIAGISPDDRAAVEQAFADQIASGSVSLGQHWTADCAEDGTIVVQETQTAGVG